jgi:HEAT repeat protein
MNHALLQLVWTRVRMMIVGCLVGFLALACTGSTTASGRYLEVSYPPSNKQAELQLGVTYTLWIPEGVTKIRGVIVHQHGCGAGACKGGATAAYDLHWQALAKKWDCALLGPSYHQDDKQNCRLWCDPRNGSHQTFLKALGEIATQAKHPEIETAPWCLWGHSGGAFWASLMQTMFPERIVAIWFRSGTAFAAWEKGEIARPEIPAAAYRIPMMCNPGAKEKGDKRFDGAWTGSLAMFQAYRAKGAPIGFAPDPRTAHECGDSRYLAIPFFDTCLAMRLPAKDSKTQDLRPADMRAAWLATLLSDKAEPATVYAGRAEDAVWLPNERIAKVWSEYVKTGAVSDTSPPPTPFQVKARVKADQAVEITWDAEADLDSGIKAFIIQRDGQDLAQVPEKPVGRFGRPLFQSMSYHDTPEKPLPEMRFIDRGAKPGVMHEYRVMTVNSVGLKSEPARAKAKAKELDVLFIGNSQIYFNDLPRTVEALAESAADDRPRIRADRFVSGGASLERLWNAGEGKGTARAKILEKKWDFVIVQEIFNVKPDGFNKYAPLFHELIEKNGARTVLFCTASVSTMVPKGFHELHDMHIAMGKKLQVPVAAGGKAWLSYWGDMPTAEERLALYDPDKAHPGKKGSYLYACTLYAALTGRSPVGLTNRIPKQPADAVTEKEARHFQEAAWRVHQDVNPVKKAPPAKLERMTKIRADLKSTHVEVRRAAIRALVHSDISELLREDMQAALADSDAEMRATAATAIGNLGSAAVPALPALIGQMQNDSSKEARETAARALGRIGKAAPKERQALPALRQTAAKDADPVTRVVALGALAMMEADIPEQVAALRKYLPHDSSLVRMKAAHALGMIGPAAKAAAPEIVSVLERATDTHERGYIARALGNTGDPASLPALYKAIEKETDAGTRGEMRGAISRLGGKAPAK